MKNKKIYPGLRSSSRGVCFQALDGLQSGKNVSSWSYQGKSIPFIKVDNNIFYEDYKKALSEGKPFGFANTYKKSIERALLSYESMGHPMAVPYVIPISFILEMPMNGGIFTSGGTVDGNAKGQYNSFQETIKFFKKR